jgi:hypothetical protein
MMRRFCKQGLTRDGASHDGLPRVRSASKASTQGKRWVAAISVIHLYSTHEHVESDSGSSNPGRLDL